jgi:hypothetical protein
MTTVDSATGVASIATDVASYATGLAATAAKVPIPRDTEVALARDLRQLFDRFAEEVHAWQEFVDPDYQADEQEVLLTKLQLTEAAPYLIRDLQQQLLTRAKELAVGDDRIGNACGLTRQAVAKRTQLLLRRGPQK